ncbi:NET1 (YJL076W) and TOF2 (YKR010C) [Zygosaccharomyces parabailii]|nr:NET1 (YJL076W) and TOF2 (YKR010C) [Zygosaccharomyces parabailii]CDH12513.1 uncharacterized protein ZBAI_04299 [Zygosaccharomyces bailii ISA1307]
MFKLQVVLVPPSAQNVPLGYGLASSTAESSQLMGVNPMTAPRNQETTLPYAPSGNTSLAPYHFAARLRKFLHFTKSANTLLELSAEIDEKCAKMYPYVDELEILSLQDSQGCDLDPDFLVKDVFTMDNVVRVIIKNELEIDDSSPVSSYRAAKRKKLNSGVAQSPPSGHQQSQVLASTASSGILNIAKKRPAAFAMRHSTNNNMRVSTPLAHQIYPLPNSHDRMVSNNSEDEDDDPGERSFLPPPAQPQSPPIRISSGMDTGKKIKSMIEDDTVSRSETVDPDKLRQQRLLSGTPVRSAMTPNRVTLTGQRVVSEHQPPQPNNASLFTAANGNRKNSFATTRITSGRLSIPEPKIAEIEKELKEGPSSPSSMLPPKPDRIPMKKPLQETEEQASDDDYYSEDQETDRQVRAFIQRQTSSIADNNGSPTKNSPLSDDDNVHLAELPQTRPRSVSSQQRKTSLEAKVEHKLSGGYSEEEPLRIDNFSEDEDTGAHDKEQDRQWEGEIDRNRIEQKSNAEENDADSNDTANETVVVRGNLQKPTPTNSINKEELLKFMEGDYSSAWNNHSSKGKPYTTVLHKDIDNSKPDPRNILPEKMTRGAAKRAAQLLAGTMEHGSGHEPANVVEDSSSDSSSGIESDLSQEDEKRISVAENNATKTLNIHPLKETVIEGNESSAGAKALRRLSKSDSERSEGTSFGSSTDQEQYDPSHAEKEQLGGHKETLPAHRTRMVSNSLNTSEKNFSLNQQEKPLIHISPAATSPNGAIANKENDQFSTEKEPTGSIPKSSSIVRPNNLSFRHNAKKADTETPNSSSSLEKDNYKALSKEAPKDVKSGEAKTRKIGKEKQKQIEKESKQKAREDAKKAKEEETARKRREREEKKKMKQVEIEKKKKLQQEEKKRLQAEMEKKREEEFKKQQELLERRKQEFYEKKRQEELERQRREEEGRKKEADMVKRRLEELGRKKREEMERKKLEDEEKRRQEELARRRQEEAESKRQEEQERKKQEEIDKKRLQEEAEKKKQGEQEKKRLQEEAEKKKQEEQERNRLHEEAEKKKQEEQEKNRLQEEAEKKKLQKEAEEKKRLQEEQEKKQLQEEAERNKEQERRRQEETEKKRQEEQEKRRLQEEEEKRRKASLEKKQQEEEQEKERQAKLEKKKQDEELQRKKRTDLEKKKQQEDLQKKRQAELERRKLQDEVQRRKHADQEKKKQEQVKKKPKTLSVAKPGKSPAAINGSDKLKELKARFTSSKTYVPASSKGSQRGNKGGSNEDTESSDEGSSTEYSSSSSEDEEEPSSKKSRRKVVDTPKGSLTSGRQKPASKELGGVEAAPQSTQRSNFSSQSSQNQVPVTRMMEMSSPSRNQADTSANSSILAGLPKKIRPSLSSLSDLVSRGVPEVKEKSNSSQNSANVHPRKVDTDSDAGESDENNDSETESDSTDSDSDDSDSEHNSFISAKTANTALGKKKKGSGGFASLLRDSQKK